MNYFLGEDLVPDRGTIPDPLLYPVAADSVARIPSQVSYGDKASGIFVLPNNAIGGEWNMDFYSPFQGVYKSDDLKWDPDRKVRVQFESLPFGDPSDQALERWQMVGTIGNFSISPMLLPLAIVTASDRSSEPYAIAYPPLNRFADVRLHDPVSTGYDATDPNPLPPPPSPDQYGGYGPYYYSAMEQYKLQVGSNKPFAHIDVYQPKYIKTQGYFNALELCEDPIKYIDLLYMFEATGWSAKPYEVFRGAKHACLGYWLESFQRSFTSYKLAVARFGTLAHSYLMREAIMALHISQAFDSITIYAEIDRILRKTIPKVKGYLDSRSHPMDNAPIYDKGLKQTLVELWDNASLPIEAQLIHLAKQLDKVINNPNYQPTEEEIAYLTDPDRNPLLYLLHKESKVKGYPVFRNIGLTSIIAIKDQPKFQTVEVPRLAHELPMYENAPKIVAKFLPTLSVEGGGRASQLDRDWLFGGGGGGTDKKESAAPWLLLGLAAAYLVSQA